VFQLGGAFKATPELTVRVGYNRADNPVPNKYVSFLFPATVENHYTAGVGYQINNSSGIDFALSYVPEVKVKESNTETNNLGTTPATTITHSQVNWQIMYTYMY
jgi:long-chain fatty acid transport protein